MTNHGLTNKEVNILSMFAIGMPRNAVAEKLGITTKTLRGYLSLIYEKIGVGQLHQAVVWFYMNKINPPGTTE
jgi:DNA-binding CsgD family transcriptional regulator